MNFLSMLRFPLKLPQLPSQFQPFGMQLMGKKYKLKTHSGMKKRFKFTGTGLLRRFRSGHRHHSKNKSGQQMRDLGKPTIVPQQYMWAYRKAMPYGR